jgi:hypothetical protein
MPERIQRKRTKGFKLPDNTVCVTRPGMWGNPYSTAGEFREVFRYCVMEDAVPEWTDRDKGERVMRMVIRLSELRGKNLACWCGKGADCHASVLLDFANPGDV